MVCLSLQHTALASVSSMCIVLHSGYACMQMLGACLGTASKCWYYCAWHS